MPEQGLEHLALEDQFLGDLQVDQREHSVLELVWPILQRCTGFMEECQAPGQLPCILGVHMEEIPMEEMFPMTEENPVVPLQRCLLQKPASCT